MLLTVMVSPTLAVSGFGWKAKLWMVIVLEAPALGAVVVGAGAAVVPAVPPPVVVVDEVVLLEPQAAKPKLNSAVAATTADR
jgi:hypothetical protein